MKIIMVDLMNMQIIAQILQLSPIYCTNMTTISKLFHKYGKYLKVIAQSWQLTQHSCRTWQLGQIIAQV